MTDPYATIDALVLRLGRRSPVRSGDRRPSAIPFSGPAARRGYRSHTPVDRRREVFAVTA
jgi:hypothetical protein